MLTTAIKTVIDQINEINGQIEELKQYQIDPLSAQLIQAIIQTWLNDRPEIASVTVEASWQYNDSDYDPRAWVSRIEYVLGDALEYDPELDWNHPTAVKLEDASQELTDLFESYREYLFDGGSWEKEWKVTSSVHTISV